MPRSVLITGANGGIGKALCQEFALAKYFVIATDRIEADCICHEFILADLTKICLNLGERGDFINRVKQALPSSSLSALINNAAVQILHKTEDVTVEEWHQTLDTNLIAPFMLIQGLLPELEKAQGSVINIASVHAMATKPAFITYATSKAALVGLTKTLAVDLGSRVRVNALLPGATATPMLLAGFEGKSSEFELLSKMHPLERIATPQEIAKAAVFLASEEASFITGASINVDGGISVRLHDPV